MHITDYLRPKEWLDAVRTPFVLRTHYSVQRCQKYFRRKNALSVRPEHDRDLELVYVIHAKDGAVRISRKAGTLRNTPIGFGLSIVETEGATQLELRLDIPPWFFYTMGTMYALLGSGALFLMDWWPCMLTLLILGTLLVAILHIAATDRKELARFLEKRFGDKEDNWFDDGQLNPDHTTAAP